MFDFRRRIEGSYYDNYRMPASRGTSVVKASGSGAPGGVGSAGGGGIFGPPGGGGGRGVGMQHERWNPVYDRLEEPSVVDDWIPRDPQGLNALYRLIFLRDPIAGPAVDIYSSLPWSEFDLLGVEDPSILKIYQDFLNGIEIVQNLQEWATEYLVLGKVILSLLWNDEKGYWDDFVPQDPDFLRITPRPVRSAVPKVDFRPSPGVRQFIFSDDPRDKEVLEGIPPEFADALKGGGWVQLDPMSTLYLARRSNPYDTIGTSFYTRILTLYALEKQLINTTVISAKRRARSILHVTAGIDDRWEPTIDEMNEIAGMFIATEEDPSGGVVVTRTGVETSEIRDGQNFWKWSDEWGFLSEAKMRGLGISDAFLSGDATYSNMESAHSILVENIRTFRSHLTARIFYEMMFPTIARVHGFVKRKQCELDHNIRTTPTPKQPKQSYLNVMKNKKGARLEDALDIEIEDLIMPEVAYRKQLRPEADSDYLDLLSTLEEKGVPIPLKTWALSGGVDLQKIMSDLEEDKDLRLKIYNWKQEAGVQASVKGNSSEPYRVKEHWNPEVKRLLDVPIWDKRKEFIGLKYDEVVGFLDGICHKEVRADADELAKRLYGCTKGNTKKMELLSYLLMRLGLASKLTVGSETARDIAAHIYSCADGNPKKMMKELTLLQKVISGNNVSELDLKKVANFNKKKFKFADSIPSGSNRLLSGY